MLRIRQIRRKLILWQLGRATREGLLEVSRKRLEACFFRAAQVSPAYRTLLSEAGVATKTRLSADAILQKAPLLDKTNTFARFAIRDLVAKDLSVRDLAGVLTSSGQGRDRFAFGVSTWQQMGSAPDEVDLGLQSAFDIDASPTLLVNCLPMGVTFPSRSLCIANVSVREDMALGIIRDVGPMFEQIIVCADPLFLKRLLDHARELAFRWDTTNTQVVLGEETFSEDFRTYVGSQLGIDVDNAGGRMIGSSMGVGELGLNLLFETRDTVSIRRALYRRDPLRLHPTFFCYNPMRTYVEITDPDDDGIGELVLTVLDSRAPIPLIRYRTGDLVRWPRPSDLSGLPAPLEKRITHSPVPIIAFMGRKASWERAGWQVDHVKSLLYRQANLAAELSGAFHLSGKDPDLVLEIQLRRGSAADPNTIAEGLRQLAQRQAAAQSSGTPAVRCFRHELFPHGISLDYERKFQYHQRA